MISTGKWSTTLQKRSS